MFETIYVNGRFLSQKLSGVQRFATELTIALSHHFGSRLVVLAPPGASSTDFPVRTVGSGSGQGWEQVQLPWFARDGLLLNLGNTAPLSVGTQLVTIHDAGVYAAPEAYSRLFRLWYKILHARLARSQAGLVTVSLSARSDLSLFLKISPGRIGVVSEGADHMDRIKPDESILARLPPGRFVLAVGNLAAHKNLSSLSLLAERLRRRGAQLVITGNMQGSAFAAGSADIPRAAHYAGRVSDAELRALYQQAVCLVLPSRYEGFGLPAVEAMACGCPVVAARIPALVETCGGAAIYCDPASPDDIANKVETLFENAIFPGQLRILGQTRAEQLTWKRAGALMVVAIEDYVNRRAVKGRPVSAQPRQHTLRA